MKFKSTTLVDENFYQLSLIKYSKEYEEYLKEVRKMNLELAYCVEESSRKYGEFSDYQSYMIVVNNSECIGAIYIGSSVDEKGLELKLQFDENKFKDKSGIVVVAEQVVDLLGAQFEDYEYIEVELLNDVDLSLYDVNKYRKTIYSHNYVTYTCSNSKDVMSLSLIK